MKKEGESKYEEGRREEAGKELERSVSAHERELPKVSFLSSEEITRLANADPRQGGDKDGPALFRPHIL